MKRTVRSSLAAAAAERHRFSPVFERDGRALWGLGLAFMVPTNGELAMRYVLLWLLGIPIPVLILLAVFDVI